MDRTCTGCRVAPLATMLLAFGLLPSTACTHASSDAIRAGGAAIAPVSSGAPAPPESAQPDQADARPGGRDINAGSRAAPVLSVNDAFKAFDKAGIKMEKPERFHAPEMFASSNCAGAHASGEDLMVIVCEYPDVERATAGFEVAHEAEPALGPRNLARHETLVIRIMDREVYRSKGTKETWEALLAAFHGLAATP